jgi:hypothetical protein
MAKVMLKDLAYTRSGDKGDICNIGVMPFNKENYEIVKKQFTSQKIKAFFKGMVKGDVDVYDLPNLSAFNVVLHNALDGGATRTLRLDQTGKSMCCALLRMELEA